MSWMPFESRKKDFHEIIQENQKKYPLYGFLSFLLNYEGKHKLTIVITGDRRKTKIQEMSIRFGNEETQTFKMGELPVFDYQWFLKRPEMLLEHFDKLTHLVQARARYDKIVKKMQEVDDVMGRAKTKGSEGLFALIEANFQKNAYCFTERWELAIRHGALFSERLHALYEEYANLTNQPKAEPTPAPDMSVPVHDIIEVELLTILEDPDISDLTKSDAKETLEVYRQEKVTVERNPKEENARIAIQTIRKYYTKNDREAVGEGG